MKLFSIVHLLSDYSHDVKARTSMISLTNVSYSKPVDVYMLFRSTIPIGTEVIPEQCKMIFVSIEEWSSG